MPHSIQGLSSGALSSTEIRRAMMALPAAFQQLLGDTIIIAYYGWGCILHADLQYVPMRVSTHSLEGFVRESLGQEIVIPGGSDFCFTVPEGRLEILFCHEGDIHLKGSDSLLLDALQASGFFAHIAFKSWIKC
jgi:hypothetical protein